MLRPTVPRARLALDRERLIDVRTIPMAMLAQARMRNLTYVKTIAKVRA